jgi:heme-degrading monooxygenase HmoA
MSVYAVVSHRVADFEAWKPVFEEHEKVRRQHGAVGHRLLRSVDDPGRVVVITEFGDESGARAFTTDPSLPEAMKRGGVDGQPDVYICDRVESVNY